MRAWFQQRPPSNSTKVVEIGGRYGFASVSLLKTSPDLSFEVRCDSQDFLRRGEALVAPGSKDRIAFTHVPSAFEPLPANDSESVLVYVIRNLFWNWTDEDVIRLLRTLTPALESEASVRILVTDGVSPLAGEFPPLVESAYRRRDITMMTMHNVKQRTQVEWLDLFGRVHPKLKV